MKITIQELDERIKEYSKSKSLSLESDLTKPLKQWELRPIQDQPVMIFLMAQHDLANGARKVIVEKHIVTHDGWTSLPQFLDPDFVYVEPEPPKPDTIDIAYVNSAIEALLAAGITDVRYWKSVCPDSFEPYINISIPYRLTKSAE
ncbi:hypothetical protein PHIM7_31 [Sinorhizobium phage phiM7]|uniref:Uncharacterized protein n=2 Tax=Emdodecavirus TaxID=1980937 RepID=S5MV02_9CAUD|nr:hypothetical protein AB690_gp037 [Sinorhizobium phage phiM12]YP_009601156.1 hypothetical protein FDH46_gp031 [Sinorhizobium phage phiM7]AGR47677.1 hypothetical protein SmphiM12_045 [Sinorhizobium phage phiM12]AKF12579.1 hypothetical protein PHIM7_31 [Sinorhizobium phage phiM7]AKF12939.1 hypothetical protein PHIM19_32 [Sinorhizobium phage phiM19]